MRQSLSDITNSQSQEELNLQETGLEPTEQVNRLMKVKALQHEVTCKNALLKAKCCEQKKDENTQPRTVRTPENVLKIADEESEKPSVPNRRRFIRSKSLGESPAHKMEAEKEESATKRRQLRRKSARVRSAATPEMTENLFEIKDLHLTMPNDMCQQDKSTMASHNRNKEEEEEDLRRSTLLTRHQDCKFRRQSPVKQTLRRAIERIQSYKEISLNTKMRRS
ncbi:hypothetical protein EUTSA_v10002903mg [Eutrema salsugineum]|uniref:Shugoshin C-terminal domain-containing protein n=1 Tax=Eutrema salsugineum TaxID=72664 RepID=V4MYB8_EUTSA|nr:hypothetical protein EUTSA_v10002903mg [Eutrema salsugineum]